jgi:transposase
MEAYSLDLRQRIIKGWQQGQTKSAIARTFMVSLSSVKRYVQRFKRQGNVLPTVQRRRRGKLNAKLNKRLARQLEAHPDFTLVQHREWWNRRHGEPLQVSESLLSRAFRRFGWTRKKKTIGAAERDEAARAAFRAMMKTLPVKDIVVLDESSTRIGMIPLYARAPRGCRAYDRTIQNYGRNVTLLASMTGRPFGRKGTVASMRLSAVEHRHPHSGVAEGQAPQLWSAFGGQGESCEGR